jgi:hypothetical protein
LFLHSDSSGRLRETEAEKTSIRKKEREQEKNILGNKRKKRGEQQNIFSGLRKKERGATKKDSRFPIPSQGRGSGG